MKKPDPYTKFKLWLIKAVDEAAKVRQERPDLFYAYTNCMRNIMAGELAEE